MKTPYWKDVVINGAPSYENISLVKLVQQPISDVVGYLSDELGGGAAFKIIHIVLADGIKIRVEGERDFPYVSNSNNQELNDAVLNKKVIDRLYAEEERIRK